MTAWDIAKGIWLAVGLYVVVSVLVGLLAIPFAMNCLNGQGYFRNALRLLMGEKRYSDREFKRFMRSHPPIQTILDKRRNLGYHESGSDKGSLSSNIP